MSAKRSKSDKRKKPAGPVRALSRPTDEVDPMLAYAVPANESPSSKVKDLLLARIRASRANDKGTAAPGWRFESVHAEAGWRKGGFPGVRFKTLSVDTARDVAMVLIEMQPGATFPDHVHEDGGDEGIVISGDVITGGRLLRAGDYYFAAEGTTQNNTVSPSGCTALISLTVRALEKWRQFAGAE